MTIGSPAFCLFLYLTGVHFRGELKHFGGASEQELSVDQSEHENYVVSASKTDFMLNINITSYFQCFFHWIKI